MSGTILRRRDRTARPPRVEHYSSAVNTHHVCIVDGEGTILGERAFRHGGAGLAEMADWLVATANAEAYAIGVAIEIPHGPVVETLMERGFAVHSLNPKQLDRFRDRFSPAGAKDDRRDARSDVRARQLS